jgi:SAM-dependent methyltransferase
LRLAANRGATVAGLDAAAGLLAVARELVPDADLRLGDLGALPYPDDSFDVVTSFNAIQYAADPVAALGEAKRVTVPGGKVVIVTWGEPRDCESRYTMAALRDLVPPPPGAGGPFALSAPGKLEELAEAAGLSPQRVADVTAVFTYPDLATAVRIQLASGPARRTMAAVGEPACREALTAALAHSSQDDGSYRQVNTFRYLISGA